MTWTRFVDMYSGGDLKMRWRFIYIEADEDMSEQVFFQLFGRHPGETTCECCGPDYSYRGCAEDSLRAASAYERGCDVENDVPVERGGARFVPFETFLGTKTLKNGEKARIVTAADIAALVKP